ncbi:MAG: hypothetical protein V7677_19140 [Motiliproteus sp.]
MSHVTRLFNTGPNDYQHRIVRKAEYSWWVFRHLLGEQRQPLPYGTVVYFARTPQDAGDWVKRIEGVIEQQQAA